jgi:5'-3' exonuclease
LRLHLIDGTFELYRAHYSPRPGKEASVGPNGAVWDVKASVGVVSSMLALLGDKAEAVTHMAIAFDNPIRSFRNDLFADYKSDEGVPPELRQQFDLVEEGCRALGLPVWRMEAFEADDGLATGARRFKGAVDQVRIMSPDKDLGACLDGERVVIVDRIRARETTEATFRAARGFGPASMPDYLALVGDSADGIPGLRGFGEKSTGSLLGMYPHLEDIPASAQDWGVKLRGADKLAATLQTELESAKLYRTLATLRFDATLPHDNVNDLAFHGPGPTFAAWSQKVGAPNLLRAAEKLAAREA